MQPRFRTWRRCQKQWNVRITQSDQPALVAQMQETFDQYWADAHQFEQYDHRSEADGSRLRRALTPDLRDDWNDQLLVEVEPKDFQKPVLEELAMARSLERHRNLIVAATGTGKTVMAAMDYRALRESGQVETLRGRRLAPSLTDTQDCATLTHRDHACEPTSISTIA